MSDPMHPYNETYGGLLGRRNRPPVIQGVPISAWKANEQAPRCGICVKKFGFLRRRHHCRACGDICCRRCLGFLLVDVPIAGVDISFTCLRCITRHNTNPSIREDIDHLAQAIDKQSENRIVRARRRETSPDPMTPTSLMMTPPTSALNSPASVVESALTPTSSPRAWDLDYKVIVSQYHNHKLHSVCSLLGDYLECKGGAIVLMDDIDVWVLAHKGLRSSAMHSPNFLSLCHHAMKSKETFTASRDRKKMLQQHQEIYRFFGAAPIFHRDKQFSPIGCIVAMDTKLRDEPSCKRVKKTLENLARLVSNVLAEEENVMRMYSSGDFKYFASGSNSLDGRPTMSSSADASLTSSPLDRFGVESPLSSPMSAASPVANRAAAFDLQQRSRSFIIGDNVSFYERYADEVTAGSKRLKHSTSTPDPKLAKTTRAPPPPPPRTHDRAVDHSSAA